MHNRKYDWKLLDTKPIFARADREIKSNTLKNFWLVGVIFGISMVAGSILQFVPMLIYMIIAAVTQGEAALENIESTQGFTVFALYLTVLPILVSVLYCKLIERRSLRSMGFTKQHCIRDYLVGFVLAIVMMGSAVLVATLGGGLQFEGFTFKGSIGMLLLFIGGWMIQGLSEEIVFRSYLLVSLGTKHNRWIAVLVSSLLFAAAHLGNDGVTVLSIVNLTLYGAFAAIYFLRTDSVWGIAALHSFWNCAQGNLFGQKVSGIVLDTSLFTFSQKEGYDWLHGGSFGPEGGVAITLVLLVGITILLLLPQRKTHFSGDSAPNLRQRDIVPLESHHDKG